MHLKKSKKVADGITFFKVGVCAERTLVCAVKSAPLSSTVKVYEPVGLGTNKRRGKLGKLFRGVQDLMKLYKVKIFLSLDLKVYVLFLGILHTNGSKLTALSKDEALRRLYKRI
jgi:hypothetical protein